MQHSVMRFSSHLSPLRGCGAGRLYSLTSTCWFRWSKTRLANARSGRSAGTPLITSRVAPMRHTVVRKIESLRCCSGLAMCERNSESVCALHPLTVRTRCAIERSNIANLVSDGSPRFVKAIP